MRVHPVVEPGEVDGAPGLRFLADRLQHRVDVLGWRLGEEPGLRMLPDELEALGVRGPEIGRLQAAGQIEAGGRTVRRGGQPSTGRSDR